VTGSGLRTSQKGQVSDILGGCFSLQRGLLQKPKMLDFFPKQLQLHLLFPHSLPNSALIGPGNHINPLRTRRLKIFGLFLPECWQSAPRVQATQVLYLWKTWLRRNHLAFDGLARPCFDGITK
jgi:hypothetical protein